MNGEKKMKTKTQLKELPRKDIIKYTIQLQNKLDALQKSHDKLFDAYFQTTVELADVIEVKSEKEYLIKLQSLNNRILLEEIERLRGK